MHGSVLLLGLLCLARIPRLYLSTQHGHGSFVIVDLGLSCVNSHIVHMPALGCFMCVAALLIVKQDGEDDIRIYRFVPVGDVHSLTSLCQENFNSWS